MRQPGGILLRLPSWLGDLVACEGAVRAVWERLEARGRAGELSLAAPAGPLALFDGRFPGARRIPHGRHERASDWRGQQAAVLFTGSFRSAWSAWRAGIPRRIGWSRDGRRALLTDSLAAPLERGAAALGSGRAGNGRRYLPRPVALAAAELLALAGIPVADPTPRLDPSPAARAAIDLRLARLGLARDEPFCLVNVGARPGSAKAYPAWSGVLPELQRTLELKLVVIAGPAEASCAEAATGECQPGCLVSFADPAPELAELIALAARAAVCVTPDVGPRHVMGAVGARTLCLIGPTDARHTAWRSEPTRLVSCSPPPACAPCHAERCPLPRPERQRCMHAIDPSEISRGARELLELP